ncbi:MAG TPA: MerR family transcriptional regulator [Longimicrobium sp.]|nr:MerR family transcriptional regulator [Longimicrobium sp.]
MPTQTKTTWKVGELAKSTGLSVRTLHYYDEIGLLSPSAHTAAGHRLYTEADVARLQQVVSLRDLGFPLEKVREVLDERGTPPQEVIRLHIGRLREQMELQRRLVERLEWVADRLDHAARVSGEDLITAIKGVIHMETYYTPEQLETIRERGRQLGEEGLRKGQEDWQALMAEVRAEMDAGTDPASEKVQALARRWAGLVRQFTGGDPGIAAGVKKMWDQEESIQGIDTAAMREMMAYIGRAMQAGGINC